MYANLKLYNLCKDEPKLDFSGSDRLDRGNHVFQFGNVAQGAPRRQSIVLGHRQYERALVRLQAFEEGVELVEHELAVTVSREGDNATVSIHAPVLAFLSP